MNGFRLLRADEIDCRVAQVKENGLSLLLYKDARCDMNILDETVGMMNWQRKHSRENANCVVSIWDETKQQWVEKEDTGTESNTEAEKGLASDSFKRACFNWGIGRELYTAPFIWISSDNCEIKPNGKDQRGNTRFACYDRFTVKDIGYNEKGEINKLVILRQKTGKIAYQLGSGKTSQPKAESAQKPKGGTTGPVPKVEDFLKVDGAVKYAQCADCGEWIADDQKKKDGSPFPIEEYLQQCIDHFGKPVCRNCMKKQK